MKSLKSLCLLLCLVAATACAKTPNLTHGITIGDVTHEGAVVWARTDGPAHMHLFVVPGRTYHHTVLESDSDYAGQIELTNLEAGRRYRYYVWFDQKAQSSRPKSSTEGTFDTAPSPSKEVALTFLWSGDLGGQNVCRDAQEGYPIFDVIYQEQFDFFVGLGDMIYADGVCETTGAFGNEQLPGEFPPAQSLRDFWAHWRYNFGDPGVRRTLSKAPYFAIWDDHEVINDFGPTTAMRDGEDLLSAGLQAFLDYNPIAKGEKRLYRSVRWGKHLEIFVLDTRLYRDPNLKADIESADKSLLGETQRRWLIDGMTGNDATWKVLVSSVPISIPTGFPAENGRDGWANFDQDTGFERELSRLLSEFQQAKLENLVWLTTDVHFAAVYRYKAFGDSADPYIFHEAMVGPLSAGIYPNENFDTTFGPTRLFFYAPPTPIGSFHDSKPWMSYGRVRIQQDGRLTLSVINGLGTTVFDLDLMPGKP